MTPPGHALADLFNDATVARTKDGVLHVLWQKARGTAGDLVVTTISARGKVGGTSQVTSGWTQPEDGTIVASSSGLQVLFSGFKSSVTADPYNAGSVHSATWRGSRWVIAPAPPTANAASWPPGARVGAGGGYGPVAATLEKDGTVVGGWNTAGNANVGYQVGLDPTAAKVLAAAGAVTQVVLATDPSTGEVYASWWSATSGANSVHLRRILPSVGPDKVLERNKAGIGMGGLEPARIVAREGGGVCAAYPVSSGQGWVGVNARCTGGGAVRAGSGPVRYLSIAPARDGRVWALWTSSDIDGTVYAARSNRTVTRFGTPVAIAPPSGTKSLGKVVGDATSSSSAIDLVAEANPTLDPKSARLWHIRVDPGLTLVATGGKVSKFVVLDAGEPVSRAHVKLSGPQSKLLTTTNGVASASGLPPGKYTVTASAVGYTAATATIQVP